ncbi:glycine--tRNA ligase subunit beta [Lusitaniella coriacea]|uniref:glycine--tRNA ligase subunit beta n=1 Tax=Lusitaniella coriacea TaxID=1983105 RepID=UPI003CFA3A14
MPAFLLEVGTEELPADFVNSALQQWQKLIPESLKQEFLALDSIEIYATPRRLAVLIQGLPTQQRDREEEIKGPPAKAAFKDGKPTKAAEGFARKQGVDLEALEVRETDKGEFVFVQKTTPGRKTTEILSELSRHWVDRLEGRRFMRWADGDLRFPRPIRWLVALWDDAVLPLEWVNGSETIQSDRASWGHRVLHPEPLSIPQATNYVEQLRSACVEVDPAIRRQRIAQGVRTIARTVGGYAEIPSDLLEEVINLVESPTAAIGQFDPQFLNLPPEVITTVMIAHQRYFPVRETQDSNGKLLPYFITVSNGDPAKSTIIAAGNERVIRARLADAQFFYDADCDEPLETYLPQLDAVTFQEDLGSLHDKVKRLMEIAEEIANQLDLTPQQREAIERAGLLCKVDLVSQMVYEFPELQGVMGEKYALASGESPEVARAIFEHYLPRGAKDVMPESLTGQVISIADRADTLVGIFGLGMLPTGSSDPFALRRAANAILEIIWHANLGINLDDLLQQFSADFASNHTNKESPYPALQEFFLQRIRTLLQEELEIDYDLVKAVLGEGDPEYAQRALKDVLDARDRAQFLQTIRNNRTLDTIYETVNRSTRLAAKGDLNTQELDPAAVVRPDLFEKSSEQRFHQALVELVPTTQAAQSERNYQLLVEGLAKIAPVVSDFFDGEDSVLVMDENPEIQQNRLNLLGLLRNHARSLADFGAIVKSVS